MKHLIQTPARAVLLSILLTSMLGGVFPLALTPAVAAERAVSVEKNPPGDIPDSQVFVNYQSPLGFSVKTPEGWARTERQNGVHFTDKFNGIDVDINPAGIAPSVASVKSEQAVALIKMERAVKIKTIRSVSLPAGPAILIDFDSNSAPNQVTNKQLRLESNRYLMFRDGKLATLDLSAPKGSDNVDQWKLIAHSFHWN
ncbi:hypothetical protein [Rhodoferax sp.]|uniref:hypothetical protein n=1 Tax=Rhodoferax sp. TaxID=50421 RepID=UPI00284BF15E|nr:hypothetical protein [Rhodoferax sp.]MDR3369766.1 hypothetical protein [Rhodoferax sp.]